MLIDPAKVRVFDNKRFIGGPLDGRLLRVEMMATQIIPYPIRSESPETEEVYDFVPARDYMRTGDGHYQHRESRPLVGARTGESNE